MLTLFLSLDQGSCDISCLEDWIFRVSQVSLYLEMLVAEGLNVSLSGRPDPSLLPSCRETLWKELRCLLDLPTLMFLASQVRIQMHIVSYVWILTKICLLIDWYDQTFWGTF